MHHKTAKDENFPVGCLISPKLKPLVKVYYQAARFADDIADNPNLSVDEKSIRLEKIRAAFLKPEKGTDLQIIRDLGSLFASERLDASLFLDLLEAFERDASGRPIRVWEELADYCRYSAAPVGRFMLAIHDENPSTYLPAENLCALLQILNHLQSLKSDLSLLGRCYIPKDLLDRYNVRKEDLGLSYTRPEVRALLSEITAKTAAMLADAKILPAIVKNFRLRFNICVILSLTNSMIQKNIKADILQNPPELGIIDWALAFAKGLVQALLSRKHPVRNIL